MVEYEFNKIDKTKNGVISEMELNNFFPYSEVSLYMDKYSDSKNKPYPQGKAKP